MSLILHSKAFFLNSPSPRTKKPEECGQCETYCRHQVFGHEVSKDKVYSMLKKLIKTVLKEHFIEEREERYTVFNGGCSLQFNNSVKKSSSKDSQGSKHGSKEGYEKRNSQFRKPAKFKKQRF